MADCNETLRELNAFLDEELSEEVRVHIHEHLDGCYDCLQTFEFHAELKLVVREKCNNDEMPPDLLSKIEMCFGADLDGDGTIG